MIYEPQVECVCDKCCQESTMVTPDIKYVKSSQANPYYDFSEEAIEIELLIRRWKCLDGKHYCEACADENSNSND